MSWSSSFLRVEWSYRVEILPFCLLFYLSMKLLHLTIIRYLSHLLYRQNNIFTSISQKFVLTKQNSFYQRNIFFPLFLKKKIKIKKRFVPDFLPKIYLWLFFFFNKMFFGKFFFTSVDRKTVLTVFKINQLKINSFLTKNKKKHFDIFLNKKSCSFISNSTAGVCTVLISVIPCH